MIKTVKKQLNQLFKRRKTKTYEITHQGLILFSKLKPRSQKLLLDLLKLTTEELKLDSMFIEPNWEQLGFDSASNYYRYRKELVISRLIICNENVIFINPIYVNYLRKRQLDYFYTTLGLRKGPEVIMNSPLKKVSNE